ncbi:hypothetical protein Arno18_54 [Pectobacterium phage Arno18]|uniref:Uncharacterized protein n=1 Tax=Pectobacterium phage Arno18 TaxID=2500578 RepID=A0A678ZSM1_9CAUD|nr:hypothetical protein Arno18_54 [Pectobacterium phage Arno18]
MEARGASSKEDFGGANFKDTDSMHLYFSALVWIRNNGIKP